MKYNKEGKRIVYNKGMKGITLIALVITIIVLLILAGISISMLSGDNSILQKATDAKTKSDDAQIRERIRLAYNSALAKDITNQNGEVQKSTLEDELENEFLNKTIEITDSADKKEWIITIDGVTDNVPIGKDAPTVLKVADHKNEKFNTNTELEDTFGNKITVPAGFKITSDSPNSVTGGIIIEDVDAGTTTTAGSQFVWIPVGYIYTTTDEEKNDENTKLITLGRYVFDDNGNIDTTLSKTEPQDQLATWSSSITYYTEGLKNSTTANAHAKNIEDFISKANSKKGYYIGRYEARVENWTGDVVTSNNNLETNWTGYINGILVEKGNSQVFNYITQNKASELSKSMYSSSDFESDLINSYAWDTATLFLQEFDNRTYTSSDNSNYVAKYSRQKRLSSGLKNAGTNNLTTPNNVDKICNVYDMADNCWEWSTEGYANSLECCYRGGNYRKSSNYTSIRYSKLTTDATIDVSFRPILYIK